MTAAPHYRPQRRAADTVWGRRVETGGGSAITGGGIRPALLHVAVGGNLQETQFILAGVFLHVGHVAAIRTSGHPM